MWRSLNLKNVISESLLKIIYFQFQKGSLNLICLNHDKLKNLKIVMVLTWIRCILGPLWFADDSFCTLLDFVQNGVIAQMADITWADLY